MRIPQTPPNVFAEIFSNPEAMTPALAAIRRPEVQELVRKANHEYLHWDKLRRFKMPEGVSPFHVWCAVEMSRASQKQPVELSMSAGERFQYWTPSRHQEWLHRIDQDAGGFIGARTKIVPRDSDDRFVFNSLMEEAIASSQLEGASTTREVAKELLRTRRRPKNRHEQMIFNNYAAILEIRDSKDAPLTPQFLCDIHEIITANTLDKPDAAGRFRNEHDDDVCVVDSYTGDVLHRPPSTTSLKWRIDELCDFANERQSQFIHPVVKAIMLHFAIGYIHPFCDGNGRTARAIFYWFMLKSGYWLFEFLPISRIFLDAPGRYGRAYLYTETDSGDMTYFIHHNLRVIDRAVRELHEYFERQHKTMTRVREMIDSMDLNHRQLAAAYHAIQSPRSCLTIKEHAGTHNVVAATARSDLFDLEKKGILTSKKEGKAIVFRPAQHLRKRLEKGAFRAVPKSHPPPSSVTSAIVRNEQPTLPSAERLLFDIPPPDEP